MSPKDFCDHPWDSILQQTEAEIVARNVMVILKRTGNVWRELSWEEYQRERFENGAHNCLPEKPHFEKVASYCTSPEKAMQFSPAWKKVGEK